MRALSIGKIGENLVNEDAAIAKDSLIAVSDGAGGGGVFADLWSEYLVEHLPDEPIGDYPTFDKWIDSIWEPFYNDCEEKAKAEGGMLLNKFYDEGSTSWSRSFNLGYNLISGPVFNTKYIITNENISLPEKYYTCVEKDNTKYYLIGFGDYSDSDCYSHNHHVRSHCIIMPITTGGLFFIFVYFVHILFDNVTVVFLFLIMSRSCRKPTFFHTLTLFNKFQNRF